MYSVIMGSLSTVPAQPSTREDFFVWLSFTILLPLAPLFASYVTLIIFVKRNTQWKDFVDLIKDGSLFFFTTALAASSLNRLKALPQLTSTTSWFEAPLWIFLVFSIICFILTVRDKLDQVSLNLRVSLLNMQYHLDTYSDPQKSKRPKLLNTVEKDLKDVTKELTVLQEMATNINDQLSFHKTPSLTNPPSPKQDGRRERIWGAAITAILSAIVVCIISCTIYLNGGS